MGNYMSKKTSTYLTEDTLAMVRETDTVSGRINSVFDRYAEMLRRDTRTTLKLFTPAEQHAIMTACQHMSMEPAATIPGGLAVELGDSSPEEIELTDQELEDLMQRLDSLTAGQQLCLAEWIEGQNGKM